MAKERSQYVQNYTASEEVTEFDEALLCQEEVTPQKAKIIPTRFKLRSKIFNAELLPNPVSATEKSEVVALNTAIADLRDNADIIQDPTLLTLVKSLVPSLVTLKPERMFSPERINLTSKLQDIFVNGIGLNAPTDSEIKLFEQDVLEAKAIVDKNNFKQSQNLAERLESLYLSSPEFLTLSKEPNTPLKNIVYVNLDLTDGPFKVPLSSELKFAQFYSSNATATWDDRDVSKLEGKTATEALALGLESKIVLIGDKTDTFEYFGQRSPGPFVYRNPNRATQIIKDGNVWKVTDMLLQLFEGQSGSNALTIAYTLATTIVPKNNDWILVKDPGDIQLPSSPADNFLFTLDDRPNGLLGPGRNRVLVPQGQTMAVDQTAPNIDHTVPLEWEDIDKRAFVNFLYKAATSNWTVLIARQAGFTTIAGQSQLRSLIVTGATTTIAQPFDDIQIGGNGDIDIHLLSKNGDYIDLTWSVSDNYVFKVICPLGFTILGVPEDLDVETLLTNRQRLRITLSGNNFGVAA